MAITTYNLKSGVATVQDVKPTVTAIGGNGAATIEAGIVVITKAGICAITLAAPTAGTHDGTEITFISATAYAHTVTNSSPGFNGGGASKDVATFGGAKGDGFTVVAHNGVWLVKVATNVTLG